MYYLTPLIFYFLIYPMLKRVHDDRRASGDESISGLELVFWLSIAIIIIVAIAFVLGF